VLAADNMLGIIVVGAIGIIAKKLTILYRVKKCIN
jgi:hypothetical protein